MNSGRVVAGIFAVAPFGLLLAGGSQARKVDYATEVKPIFKAHCNACHSGADAAAKLDLTSAASAMKGGQSGKLVVAGNPDASLLLIRILGKGGNPQMPMGFPALPADQIETIRTWIAQGAHTEGADRVTHWAYIKPIRPAIPKVKNKSWIRNPIDSFVLAKLEQEGLKPSQEASQETLIRRASLDITGLPPSPAEIDKFLADKQPDAYERLVDRLLASPHYGERQARPWLDLARYADSDGYEKDLNRTAWKYRDWVIDAFNQNLPYDKFTIEQLAGDLMPFQDVSQLVATGFNRNTMFNREGGVDQAEAHFNVVLDRVNTTATVWLGSTLQCARCHDHKYDPFTQKDFYKMSAYFSNSVILPRGPASIGEEKWFESEMQVPSGRQVAEKTKLLQEIAALKRQRDDQSDQTKAAFETWKSHAAAGQTWTPITVTSATAASGANLTPQPDGSILASGNLSKTDTYTVNGTVQLQNATALKIEALTDPSLPAKGPGRAANFVLTGLALKVNGVVVPFSEAFADFTQEGFDAYEAFKHDSNSGWAVAPATGKPHMMVATLGHGVSAESPAKVEIVLESKHRANYHVLGHFRLAFTSDPMPEASALSASIEAILRKPVKSGAEEAAIHEFFLDRLPKLKQERVLMREAKAKMQALEDEIPTTLIMRDKPTNGPLTAYIHSRGEFLSKTDMVTAGTPAVFGATSPKLPTNRLGLAEWIASKDNPLTARVQVNRIWEQYFGRGLVETSEDFGTQGSRPSHPELLDWLATEFMARGWDMKAIHRLIVTSSTYRQSSNATRELVKRDPQNVLLARGPRFRLEAEMIRDEALSAAGILDAQVGGPSVYPLQPAGTWDTPYNGEQWMTSKGGEALRRGLYTFWKRSSPYPNFMAFDSTSREECTVRRIRTNTPLQALAMLNDEAVFIAARALGQRMLKQGGPSEAAQLTFGFRACTGRKPTPTELKRLENLVATLDVRYDKDPKAASKVAGSPKEAAYALTANVLLNLDETLTKG